MSSIANTQAGRLMCACSDAYGINEAGEYITSDPFSSAAGWLSPPSSIVGGNHNINACLVGVTQDGIVIAFRGTLIPLPLNANNLADWWQSLIQSEPKAYLAIPGKLHSGMFSALDSLWSKLVEHLKRLIVRFPKHKILLTGHSKGGAMAVLAAARFHYCENVDLSRSAVFTFAAPIAGDFTFAQAFKATALSVVRYENALDIVPLLPPEEEFVDIVKWIPIFGAPFFIIDGWDYEPIGELRYINEKRKIESEKSGLLKRRMIGILMNMLKGEEGTVAFVNAHLHTCRQNYIRALVQPGICPEIQGMTLGRRVWNGLKLFTEAPRFFKRFMKLLISALKKTNT